MGADDEKVGLSEGSDMRPPGRLNSPFPRGPFFFSKPDGFVKDSHAYGVAPRSMKIGLIFVVSPKSSHCEERSDEAIS